MGFKEQIDQILSKRTAELPKVDAEAKKVRALRSGLTQICDSLRQIKAGGVAPDFTQELADLERKNLHLLEAEEEIEHIRSRFTRKTINIGVSGQAKVGKSTLLQKISGLSDTQIPTGGELMTAVRSRIKNQDKSATPFAVITFHTEESFVRKYIDAHLTLFRENLGWSINSCDELRDFDFSKTIDDLKPSTPFHDKNIANNSLIKLRQARESLTYYREFLHKTTLILNDLDELRQYVAYPGKEDPSPHKRIYLAVRDVEIHCSFPSLDGDALELIDLPGLGEPSRNVDELHLNGLKNEVDHVLPLLRPQGAPSAFVTGDFVRNLDRLCDVQAEITKRGYFASIVINQEPGNERWVNDLLSGTNGITACLNNNTPDSVYKVYTINAINDAEVDGMLNDVLKRLTQILPEMDQDALNSYRSKLNMEEIKQTLESVRKKISEVTRIKPSHQGDNIRHGRELRGRMATTFEQEQQRIIENKKNNEAYYDAIDSIKASVKDGIENDLFKEDLNGEDWENYANNTINIAGGPSGFVEKECHRIRIKMAEKYESLDEYYAQRLEDFFNKIADMFRTNTGVFVSGDCTGSSAIKEIDEKLHAERRIGSFEDAFDWLTTIHFDFRQNIYPDMGPALQPLVPFDFETREPIFDTRALPPDRKDYPQFIKSFLYAQAKTANANVAERIMGKADFVEDFIYATLERFGDIIIRKNEEQAEIDFPGFCDVFRASLYPELYGNGLVTETQQFTELEKVIAITLKAIEEK